MKVYRVGKAVWEEDLKTMERLKDTKAAARYEPIAKGDDYCGICRFFLRAHNGCTKVQGFISARAWCKHFKERS